MKYPTVIALALCVMTARAFAGAADGQLGDTIVNESEAVFFMSLPVIAERCSEAGVGLSASDTESYLTEGFRKAEDEDIEDANRGRLLSQMLAHLSGAPIEATECELIRK